MAESETPVKKVKKKGPIRYEAIIPVLVISVITFVYFSYYFDRHLKSLVEYAGTQANGAEVNVDSINTSFIRGSFDLNRLQVTDKTKPSHNILEIGNMHFQYLWDALLRMKFVVEDASITNIQLKKPRSSPGRVLPPEPARPSKLNMLQNEVMAQVKNKYGANMLGDIIAILEGGDYKEQIQSIRETLKSETRVNAMITDVKTKREFWDGRIKELSDTSKLKQIEAEVQTISKQKNVLQQAAGVKKLTELLKEVEKQYKEVQGASKKLQTEIEAVTKYPKELQELVTQDINALKNRFQIPKLDMKDMAMHLFAGQFAGYIADARKYQALAKQYMPEKKEEKETVIPKKRAEGKNYEFPITTGYPLFWLKRAAISSKGTADSYSGNVQGEVTNVTNAPKQIKKPVVLNVGGDFPAVKVSGVKAILTLDHTRDVAKQTAMIQVNSFAVPERLFVNDKKLKFGFKNAVGTSTINASLEEENIEMSWNSNLTKPEFLVETPNKLAREMLGNILNTIPIITVNGSAAGTFSNLKLKIFSNLGDELGSGLKREIGLKLDEAQNKISALVDEKINKPKEQLLAELGGNTKNLAQLGNLQELYKKNEDKIKAEIVSLQSGGKTKVLDDLKSKGKKIFKGIKF
ncbi:MAG TPA: TIGR03545 family protein [Bacteriovoracaceae bacterium]|nr:TIGR03545 family protein [Bacteriovoracaceae bacterium]